MRCSVGKSNVTWIWCMKWSCPTSRNIFERTRECSADKAFGDLHKEVLPACNLLTVLQRRYHFVRTGRSISCDCECRPEAGVCSACQIEARNRHHNSFARVYGYDLLQECSLELHDPRAGTYKIA